MRHRMINKKKRKKNENTKQEAKRNPTLVSLRRQVVDDHPPVEMGERNILEKWKLKKDFMENWKEEEGIKISVSRKKDCDGV